MRTDSSALPNVIQATLSATGPYLLTVAEQPQWAPDEAFHGEYCVTLESSQQVWQTLDPTASVGALRSGPGNCGALRLGKEPKLRSLLD